MGVDRDLTEQQQDSTNHIHAADITIQLKNSLVVRASVTLELLNKVMQSISADELNTLVCVITEAVEEPDEQSLCKR